MFFMVVFFFRQISALVVKNGSVVYCFYYRATILPISILHCSWQRITNLDLFVSDVVVFVLRQIKWRNFINCGKICWESVYWIIEHSSLLMSDVTNIKEMKIVLCIVHTLPNTEDTYCWVTSVRVSVSSIKKLRLIKFMLKTLCVGES